MLWICACQLAFADSGRSAENASHPSASDQQRPAQAPLGRAREGPAMTKTRAAAVSLRAVAVACIARANATTRTPPTTNVAVSTDPYRPGASRLGHSTRVRCIADHPARSKKPRSAIVNPTKTIASNAGATTPQRAPMRTGRSTERFLPKSRRGRHHAQAVSILVRRSETLAVAPSNIVILSDRDSSSAKPAQVGSHAQKVWAKVGPRVFA
jgi:hypothetical protein